MFKEFRTVFSLSGRLSLFNFCLCHLLLLLRPYPHDVLGNILPGVLGRLLHQALGAQALDVHVGHGSVASSRAGFPELVASLVAVLVLHHLHAVLLQVVAQHLGVRLQPIVDCAVGHQATPGSIHYCSHGASTFLDSARFVGVHHLGGEVGGHPLGQVAHPIRYVAGHLHRRICCCHSCFDRVPGESAHLCVLVRLAQSLLGRIGDILNKLTSLLCSHLDANGELLGAPNN